MSLIDQETIEITNEWQYAITSDATDGTVLLSNPTIGVVALKFATVDLQADFLQTLYVALLDRVTAAAT